MEVEKGCSLVVAELEDLTLIGEITYHFRQKSLGYKACLLLKVQLSKRSTLVASESQVQGGEVPFVKYGYLKVAELQEAEKEILKELQQVSFPQVIEVLSSAGSCDADGCVKKVLRKAGTTLRQLNPRLEDGLLRVRGRLASAPVPYEKKHPIILP